MAGARKTHDSTDRLVRYGFGRANSLIVGHRPLSTHTGPSAGVTNSTYQGSTESEFNAFRVPEIIYKWPTIEKENESYLFSKARMGVYTGPQNRGLHISHAHPCDTGDLVAPDHRRTNLRVRRLGHFLYRSLTFPVISLRIRIPIYLAPPTNAFPSLSPALLSLGFRHQERLHPKQGSCGYPNVHPSQFLAMVV